jgi:hypothetical protein
MLNFLNLFYSAPGVKMWLGKSASFTEGSRQRHFYEIINKKCLYSVFYAWNIDVDLFYKPLIFQTGDM